MSWILVSQCFRNAPHRFGEFMSYASCFLNGETKQPSVPRLYRHVTELLPIMSTQARLQSNVRNQVLHRIIIYGEDGVREFQRLGATSSFWSSLTVWFGYYFHCGFQVWFSGPHTAPVSYLRFLKWMFCLSEKVLLLITIIRIPNDTSIPEKLNASLTGFRSLR